MILIKPIIEKYFSMNRLMDNFNSVEKDQSSGEEARMATMNVSSKKTITTGMSYGLVVKTPPNHVESATLRHSCNSTRRTSWTYSPTTRASISKRRFSTPVPQRKSFTPKTGSVPFNNSFDKDSPQSYISPTCARLRSAETSSASSGTPKGQKRELCSPISPIWPNGKVKKASLNRTKAEPKHFTRVSKRSNVIKLKADSRLALKNKFQSTKKIVEIEMKTPSRSVPALVKMFEQLGESFHCMACNQVIHSEPCHSGGKKAQLANSTSKTNLVKVGYLKSPYESYEKKMFFGIAAKASHLRMSPTMKNLEDLEDEKSPFSQLVSENDDCFLEANQEIELIEIEFNQKLKSEVPISCVIENNNLVLKDHTNESNGLTNNQDSMKQEYINNLGVENQSTVEGRSDGDGISEEEDAAFSNCNMQLLPLKNCISNFKKHLKSIDDEVLELSDESVLTVCESVVDQLDSNQTRGDLITNEQRGLNQDQTTNSAEPSEKALHTESIRDNEKLDAKMVELYDEEVFVMHVTCEAAAICTWDGDIDALSTHVREVHNSLWTLTKKSVVRTADHFDINAAYRLARLCKSHGQLFWFRYYNNPSRKELFASVRLICDELETVPYHFSIDLLNNCGENDNSGIKKKSKKNIKFSGQVTSYRKPFRNEETISIPHNTLKNFINKQNIMKYIVKIHN